MKTLTLYTENHKEKLHAFLEMLSTINTLDRPDFPSLILIRSKSFSGQLHTIRLAYDPKNTAFPDALTHFLEDIVLHENPFFRHSPKLCDAAQSLRGNYEPLRAYLQQNKTMHIEGYIVFRMESYQYQLDRLMVGLIKKLKLTE